jgi:HD superfamily phosphohydrolase YqeK
MSLRVRRLEMENTITAKLLHTERNGIEKLITFLSLSDFYSAPCSTKFHLASPGGLAQHTLNVCQCAMELSNKYDFPSPADSVTIAAICHDLCKINFYKKLDEPPTDPQMRYLTSLMSKHGLALPKKLNKAYVGILIDFMLKEYKKEVNIIPPYTLNYVVEDKLPLGHGEKSLYLAQQFIKLTNDEAMAIRWHMGRSDTGTHFNFPSGYPYEEAVKQSKLVTIIQLADMEASFMMEV